MRNYHNKHHKDCCNDDHFDCFSNKKCDCSKHDCKCEKKLFKDCICVEWSVPHGQTQTIFQTDGFEQIFASGFISFGCGSPSFVRVRFFLNNQIVGSPITVFEDSSVAFLHTKFDSISVECPGFSGTPDLNCPDACEGEICIIARFPVC